MGDETMRVLARSLSELPHLEVGGSIDTLIAVGTCWGQMRLMRDVVVVQTVQSVNVADNKLTDASLPALATAFGLMKKLQYLDISDNVVCIQTWRTSNAGLPQQLKEL